MIVNKGNIIERIISLHKKIVKSSNYKLDGNEPDFIVFKLDKSKIFFNVVNFC